MADEKVCKTCWYWRNAQGSHANNSMKFCHYMVYTRRRRVDIDGVCKSYRRRSKKDERQEFLFAEAGI